MIKYKPHIAIVEDDLDLLQSTQEFLIFSGYKVWGEASAEAFFRHFITDPVDVVVLDIGLPGEDGLSVANLLNGNPNVATIILSARDSLDDRLAGLRTGADRYLVKPINLMELAANIDAVSKRNTQAVQKTLLEQQNEESYLSDGTWVLSTQGWNIIAPDGGILNLTSREFILLYTLMSAHGEVVAKKDLIEKIFGIRVSNGVERLNVLLARLRKKAANQFTQPLPIKTAHLIGYVFTSTASIVA